MNIFDFKTKKTEIFKVISEYSEGQKEFPNFHNVFKSKNYIMDNIEYKITSLKDTNLDWYYSFSLKQQQFTFKVKLKGFGILNPQTKNCIPKLYDFFF